MKWSMLVKEKQSVLGGHSRRSASLRREMRRTNKQVEQATAGTTSNAVAEVSVSIVITYPVIRRCNASCDWLRVAAQSRALSAQQLCSLCSCSALVLCRYCLA